MSDEPDDAKRLFHATLDDFHAEVRSAVVETLMSHITARIARTGESKRDLSVAAGKALITTGCIFLGGGLGIDDPDSCLGIRDRTLAEFVALIKARRDQKPKHGGAE